MSALIHFRSVKILSFGTVPTRTRSSSEEDEPAFEPFARLFKERSQRSLVGWFKRGGGIQTKYDKHLARSYLSNITLVPMVSRGCGAPLGEAGKDNLLEFIPRPSPSSSYRFITYSYSVARGKVALSAYKRFSLSLSLSMCVFLHFQKL